MSQSKSKKRKRVRDTNFAHYRHPRWWPTWITIGLIWLLARLPLGVQWRVGRLIGELAYRTLSSRRHICRVNIDLCFPELSDAEREALVRKTFHSNGIGIMEISLAWFRDPESLRHLTQVHGLDYVNDALEKGKGILLLGGHYSTLDLGGSLVSLFIDADVMQRDHNNPLMNAVMTRSREKRYGVALNSKDLRGLFKRLRANRIVWYAADQDYGRKGIVFAPFFGVEAASITATARIAERSECVVIPFSHFRRDNEIGYDIYFHPPLEDFPSGDDEVDATRVNATIEREVRKHPDQYLWMHRRFKTRPSRDDPGFYRRKRP
ncbi:LpxL/LpxP family Kdo(2)-lipid IV(A) lauroyl/palmitoleoyl acyltransferase [Marinobacter sp. R17]|uniref:LpxL/LpxP family Kdo(2)-lipid IV(A) lauroyl/palmitoleoyl acyltransferase n=1 Tax=Marinobacter sp. R17 TaxID=2484250 RepID=UPI000F4BADD2|nr:LpxL/LpxP family Kdo(2)-lipid IV(A) lauroyl/palmitoleoyl acyltransferase [Marinobacter sp. R17]ROU00589.1 LpxL/LpxP family Kdo(2)-lipid IV(A) lauroyl/palmitoleoyl acyltransferase [Marinobacter sp. R17]